MLIRTFFNDCPAVDEHPVYEEGQEKYTVEYRPAYNSRTEKQIVQLFVAIEPEGKDNHFSVLFKSQDRLLKRTKKARTVFFPRPIFLHSRGEFLKSANYTNGCRISWKNICWYQIYK